jgi:hypothetical protein
VQDVIRDWVGQVEWSAKVRVSVDVDPYSFFEHAQASLAVDIARWRVAANEIGPAAARSYGATDPGGSAGYHLV